ncbi:DUF11 domain-containing protein [Deinococcus puniceus]|uniref:DUF11 domain-containing protein n=1 Tax=Deinococcus puniceus TaxID=1182568 RepID=A0A172T700_9DEIO|nr:DUF11 domain-containing protein [Deinococcus puniceus]ANE42727.1 hypothetical protein SU48_01970 [Deinococcus puniceus]
MKKSWSFVSVLAALALGTASAVGIPAGTVIVNTAEIVFTPEGSTTPNPPIPSNPVETKVLPVPSFTITPNDDGTAGPTFVTENNLLKQTLRPGDTAVFHYTLTNTGNVPNESYGLTTLTDSLNGAAKPTDVRYYLDSNKDGILSPAEIAAGTITSITAVDIDQNKQFFQVYTVPTVTVEGDKIGADPFGTRNPNTGAGLEPAAGFVQPIDNDNYNTVTIKRTDAGLIGPKNDPNGDGAPVTPSYPSTDPVPVTIVPTATDTQEAPVTVTTTVVTFTNTVQNNGNRPDVFEITTVAQNFPGAVVVVYVKNPDGSKGPVLPDTDGDGKPDVGTLQPGPIVDGEQQPGQTVDILVEVTFPAGTQPTTPTDKPTIVVTTTSSNDTTKSDTTKDIVLLPKVSFGDPTPGTPGGDPTPVQVGTPPTLTPGGTPVMPGTPQCITTVTSYFAMEVANLGNMPDLYNITGTAPIKLTSGATVTAPVAYYRDVNGDGKMDGGDTLLTDTNADGIPDTGLIAPGAEVKLIAALAIPCDAAAQTIVLNQTATSPITKVTVPDINDTVTINPTPVAAPVKSVDLAAAKPGEVLTYTIVGKNTSNANITKAFVKDTVPTNTTFGSWSAVSDAAGTILYSSNGTNWSATAPAAGPTVYAGLDSNNDGTISTADILPSGKSITATFTVKVN